MEKENQAKKCELFATCRYRWRRVDRMTYRHRFIVALIAFCSIAILAYGVNVFLFYNNGQRIISQQERHLEQVDTLFTHIGNSIKGNIQPYDSLINQMKGDSTLFSVMRRQQNQVVVDSVLKSILIGISNNIAYKDVLQEIQKESSLVNQEIARINSDTKALLELEFNRIQNEYTMWALWGGILTIVFLIFSFYSLFKTDEILRQSKEEFEKLKAQGLSTIAEIDEKNKTKLDEISQKADNVGLTISTSLGELNQLYEDKYNSLKAQLEEKYETQLRTIEEQQASINELLLNLQKKEIDDRTKSVKQQRNKKQRDDK